MSSHRKASSRRLGALAIGSAALALATTAMAPTPAYAADGEIRGAGAPGAIDGSYIVVLKDGASVQSASGLAREYQATVTHTYTTAVKGYAARMTEAQARRTAADPAVAYVEQDREVHALGTQSPVPSWGLDRVDQRDLPLDDTYTYGNAGTGVTAYIIDTGIRVGHKDFGGRAMSGTDTVDGDGDASDCNGHGTHVAGTVGGSSYGMAKDVRLVAVRVLDCDGSGALSGVAAGVDWVTTHHTSGPAVANMSLGAWGSSDTLENAIRASIADGVTYAIAAGNSNGNACNFTPARVPEAITVNATDSADARASFSNYGTCTDIFAPGVNITSAWHRAPSNTISGTSMAAPHVAGAAALYLSARPYADPAEVHAALTDNATKDKVANPGTGSPNRLLYVGFIGPSDPDPTPPPPRTCSGANATRTDIPDLGTAYSDIAVSGCGRPAWSASEVAVNIRHPWRGDLAIDLMAPDGTEYRLKNSDYWDSADDVVTTYTLDLSAEMADGTWRLRVQDVFGSDSGYLECWSLKL